MEVIKQMVLNLALLVVILFVFQTWHESRENRNIHPGVNFSLFLISIIISLLLSVKFNPEVRYDLRGVPLLVGCLYLGRPYSFLLFVGMIVVRSFFGVTGGFWISFLIYGSQTATICTIFQWYHNQAVKLRILISILISLFSSFCFMVGMNFLNHTMSTVEWIVYTSASAVGTGIMTTTIETWRKNNFLRRKVMQSEKIEAVSQLAASISHEVRNPLTAVQGFLQLLKDTDIDENKRAQFLMIALDEVKRAEKIIGDYLTFTKPSIDKLEKISLSKELGKAINIIEPMANMNAIEIRYFFEEILISGDSHHFQQCVINIMKNSIEAMQENGGSLRVLCYKKNYEACVEIRDSGIGMTSEQIHKLGEPYYSTKGAKGTGLGMMVTYGIIRAMKGSIQVESKVGHGTTFTLSFPLAK